MTSGGWALYVGRQLVDRFHDRREAEALARRLRRALGRHCPPEVGRLVEVRREGGPGPRWLQ